VGELTFVIASGTCWQKIQRRRRGVVSPSTEPQAECWVNWKIDPSPFRDNTILTNPL
jgi:hypothetical protein